MFFYNESDSEGSQNTGGSADEYFNSVSLLLNMNNDFNDSSIFSHTVTVNGNATIDNNDGKYGAGSGYFDGNDYLTVPRTPELQFGTGDFTIEGWINLDQYSSTRPAIFSNYSAWGSHAVSIFAGHSSANSTKYQVAIGGTFPAIQSSVSVQYNTWIHFALTREAGTVRLFIDGNEEGSTNYAGAADGQGTNVYLGISGDTIAKGGITGNIDDFRITKGVARYTANFTPPTEPHPGEGEASVQGSVGDPNFSNVQLLLPLDTDFSDASANSHTVTGNGNASIYSSGKFGAGSLELDGNDFLSVTATPELAIGTQDFTLEMWVKRNGGPNDKFYMFNVGGLQNGAFAFYVQDGYLEAAVYPTGYRSPTIDVTPAVWTHVAVTRESGTIRIFANGNQVHSATDNSSIINQDLKIGGQVWNQYNDNVGGFIDDVRLTIGVARYTANFTPPTEAHPTS